MTPAIITTMISLRARIVRILLEHTVGKKSYTPSRIAQHRSRFERNMRLFFPGRASLMHETHIAGVPVAWLEPSGKAVRTILYLHGGGFVLGSLRSHQRFMQDAANACRARVLAIDYGLAPEYPYPVALEQIQKVWETLAASKSFDAASTVIMGDSAGGGLALASVMRFRDAALPQPSCVVLLSPALDATFSGKSYQQKSKDVVMNYRKLEFFAAAYAQRHSRKNPYISQAYANLHGLPPMLLHVGSEEMLRSDAETVARHAVRDGVEATLYIGEGMWHGWHFFSLYVPEAKTAMRNVAAYIVANT